MTEQTELERRLAERALEEQPVRVYRERWATCMHAFKRLGEIGAAILDECEDCGLVVGAAR